MTSVFTCLTVSAHWHLGARETDKAKLSGLVAQKVEGRDLGVTGQQFPITSCSENTRRLPPTSIREGLCFVSRSVRARRIDSIAEAFL